MVLHYFYYYYYTDFYVRECFSIDTHCNFNLIMSHYSRTLDYLLLCLKVFHRIT
jgi:hypothetical protein